MQQLKFTNSRGESIVFKQIGSPFIMNKLTGLGDVEADNQMQKAPYQDGQTYLDSTLEIRPIGFEVIIQGVSDTDISNKRSQLSRVLNPKLGEGLIEYRYGDVIRIIKAVPEHVPKFGAGRDSRGRQYQIAMVNLICPDPYWKSISETEEPAFEPRFRFPIRGPFIMGIQRDQRIMFNDGDAPAPLHIEFFGPALNPKIINNTTGEFIKVNQELLEGERMMIDTKDSTVYFVDENGVERNVFNWIDLETTFFKLQIGENDIEYTADSDIQGAVVNISYSKLYNAI